MALVTSSLPTSSKLPRIGEPLDRDVGPEIVSPTASSRSGNWKQQAATLADLVPQPEEDLLLTGRPGEITLAGALRGTYASAAAPSR